MFHIKGERLAPRDGQYLIIPKRLYKDPQAEIVALKTELAVQSQTNAEKIERLKKEQKSVVPQLSRRAAIVRALSEASGYGKAIDDKC